MNIFFNIVLFISLVIAGTQTVAADVLDFLTTRDLELVASVNQTHTGVAGVLDCTQTQQGADLLRTMLTQPVSDVPTILQHQNAIKALVDDPALLKKIKNLLTHIAKHEAAITFFDPIKTPPSLSAVVQSFQYKTSFFEGLNESPLALNVRHVVQGFNPLVTAVYEFFLLHWALEYLTGGHNHSCGSDMYAHKDATLLIKTLVILLKGVHVAGHLIGIKDMLEFLATKMTVMNSVYQELQSLHVIVEAADCISCLLQSQPSLDTIVNLEALRAVQALVGDNYFSMTPEHEGLSLTSLAGETLVAYAAVQKNSDALGALRSRLAKLDVYCSLATMMLNAQERKEHFCFTQFVNTDVPFLEMVCGWHVMLHGKNVVCNTFKAVDEESFKYILSGPNWSGKSSLLRTIGLNTVLAQVFGIAAADKFTLKPFDKILSFMTIADDMVMGESSFIARIMRADACIAEQGALLQNQCALVLLDDSVGQGTVAERGETIACEFIKQMGSFKNNILLAASHFDRVKQLGNDPTSGFQNIRMRVAVDTNGVAHGAYTLESGVSIAQEVGILTNY